MAAVASVPPTTGSSDAGPRRELTVRAVITAVIVAALVGGSYPYVVLKLGYGPNISIVAAFFGYMAITVVGILSGKRGTRYENNMVQAAGTAAGQAGFMCVVLAAIDMLNANPALGFSLHLTTLQIFMWLTVAGLIGVLLAVPLRKHYIDEENLMFADGTAAGETLLVLDQGPKEAGPRVAALLSGMTLSGGLAILRDKLHLFRDTIPWGTNGAALHVGSEVSLLSFGSGLLVGCRIGLSMGIGMLLSWFIAPGALVSRGIVPAETFKDVVRWVMWPATGLMVAGGLTALVLKWNVLMRTFQGLSVHKADNTDLSMRFVMIGVGLLSIALCLIQWLSLHFPVWLTLVSLALSFVLMLVGTRVLGETNWAPISALANLMQAVFAVLVPHNMTVNMIGSGMSGTVAANGEHLMQVYRAGKIVGSNNRSLAILQMIGVPVGAISVAVIYPALRAKYGIGEQGLSSPISVKWAAFAELLNQGLHSLPAGCFQAMLIATGLGILMTCLEPRYRKWVPSPTAVGIGMLVSAWSVAPMVLGGVLQWAWAKFHPKTEHMYALPMASGFIAGEAIVVVVFAILAAVQQA